MIFKYVGMVVGGTVGAIVGGLTYGLLGPELQQNNLVTSAYVGSCIGAGVALGECIGSYADKFKMKSDRCEYYGNQSS